MPQTIESLGLYLLGAVFLLALLWTAIAVRRTRRLRADFLSNRAELDIHDLARQIGLGATADLERTAVALTELANALRVAPGRLRPDDVVAEVLGTSSVAGDDLLEIEARLQKQFTSVAERPLTVREVVRCLAS